MNQVDEDVPDENGVVQIFDINKLYFGAHTVFKVATDLQA